MEHSVLNEYGVIGSLLLDASLMPGDFRKLTPCDFCGHRDERKPCANCPAMV